MVYSEKPKLHARQKNYKDSGLRTIVFDVINTCNMHCSHCYFETFRDSKLISLEDLKKPLQELYEMGVYHFILGGGEPIMNSERLERIISMIHPEETYINILSNGWFISKKNVQKLKGWGVDKICFSLDSGIKEEHDKNRRHGSYDRVLEAVNNTVNAGLFASITAVPTHESLHSEGFKKLVDYAQEKQVRLQIDIAMPVGKWDGREDILLTPENISYIKKLSESYTIASDGHPLIKRDIYGEKGNKCRAGTETMYISADGELTPCVFLQFSLGNIAERSIKEMREDLLKSSWFDGKHTKCLCGEDREFFEKCIKPYKNVPKPLDAYEVFGLKKRGE